MDRISKVVNVAVAVSVCACLFVWVGKVDLYVPVGATKIQNIMHTDYYIRTYTQICAIVCRMCAPFVAWAAAAAVCCCFRHNHRHSSVGIHIFHLLLLLLVSSPFFASFLSVHFFILFFFSSFFFSYASFSCVSNFLSSCVCVCVCQCLLFSLKNIIHFSSFLWWLFRRHSLSPSSLIFRPCVDEFDAFVCGRAWVYILCPTSLYMVTLPWLLHSIQSRTQVFYSCIGLPLSVHFVSISSSFSLFVILNTHYYEIALAWSSLQMLRNGNKQIRKNQASEERKKHGAQFLLTLVTCIFENVFLILFVV